MLDKLNRPNAGFFALLAASVFACPGTSFATTIFDNGIPAGWSCNGNCGTSAADGVVTLAPNGGTQYGWVSTAGGPDMSGLGLGAA